MFKIPVSICFLGAPASGKGTLASKIQKKFDHPSVSPGLIFKNIRDQDGETAELIRESTKDGGLCPTWLTNRVVMEESKKLIQNGADYITLDGFPRRLDQLEFVLENFEVKYFLYCNSDYQTLKKMVVNRRSCKICKNIFSLLNLPEACGENCDIQNPETWEKRWDDTPELFEKRYQVYKKETFPVVSAVKNLKNFIEFDLIKDLESSDKIYNLLSRL